MNGNRIKSCLLSALALLFYVCNPHITYANGVNITGRMKVYKDNNVNMIMAKIIKSDGEEAELGTMENMSEMAKKCIYESFINGTTVNISAEYCYDGIDDRTIICKKVNNNAYVFNFDDVYLIAALTLVSQQFKSQHKNHFGIFKINKNESGYGPLFELFDHLYALGFNDFSVGILGINNKDEGKVSEIILLGTHQKISLNNYLQLAGGISVAISGSIKGDGGDGEEWEMGTFLGTILKEKPSGTEFNGKHVTIRYLNDAENYVMRFSPVN